MPGIEFQNRPGGQTLRISPLNSVFVDRHESWYAVHWNTHLAPRAFIDFCQMDLSLNGNIPVIIQSTNTTSTGRLGEIQGRVNTENEDSIGFLRFDTSDCVLVWEPSAEYRRLAHASDDVPYTAIIGFGSDKIDEKFTLNLLQRTGTEEIVAASAEIGSSIMSILQSFLADYINPSGSYEYE
jgi:hypothetical protein